MYKSAPRAPHFHRLGVVGRRRPLHSGVRLPFLSGFFLSQDDQDDSSWFWAYHPDVWSQIRMMPVFSEIMFCVDTVFFISILGSSCFILRRTCQSSCLHPARMRRMTQSQSQPEPEQDRARETQPEPITPRWHHPGIILLPRPQISPSCHHPGPSNL